MTKIVIGVLCTLIAWDVATTYYGTLSIFAPRHGAEGVINRLTSTDGIVHIVAAIFAISLIVFILSYRHIFKANNLITKSILIIGFVYDFGTSVYGTSTALSVNSNPTPPQIGIILLLSLMATASPLLINHVLEGVGD